MKKIAFALLAIVGFTTANAQQDHSVLLYGNAAFRSSTNDTKINSINWHVTPGIGYQFDKHWVAGVELSWNQGSTKPDGGDRSATNIYHAGVFGRYVHYMGGSHFYCFPQLVVAYEGTYDTKGSGAATNKASGLVATLTPNIGYMFGHGFSAYATYGSLGYETTKADGASNGTHTFSFDFDNNWSFGVSKNFGCKMHKHHHDANAEMHGSNDDKNDADEDGDKPMKKKHHHHKDSDKDDE